jgi:hypothetical protein
MERLEYTIRIIYAWSIVSHLDLNHAVAMECAHGESAQVKVDAVHRLDAIPDQIHEHLLDLDEIEGNQR